MKISATKITGFYFLMGCIWILLGDYLLWSSSENVNEVWNLELLKGLSYVIFTSIGLYYLLKLNERRLKDINREYIALFRGNPNPMWIYEFDTLQILAVNDAAVMQYGYARQEWMKLTILDLRPEKDQESLKATLADGLAPYQDSGIWTHRDKHGRDFYCHIYGSATKFKGKNARLVVSINVDEQVKNRIRILKQNKKLRRIAQLTAHDLRSPISSILGLVSIFDKTNTDHNLNIEVIQKLEETAENLDKVAREMVNKAEIMENTD